jgi:hypothetical protein
MAPSKIHFISSIRTLQASELELEERRVNPVRLIENRLDVNTRVELLGKIDSLAVRARPDVLVLGKGRVVVASIAGVIREREMGQWRDRTTKYVRT